MVRKLVVLFTSVVLFTAANAKALGLGEITIESALNQPLVARVELLQLGSVRPDQISVGLASQRDFDRFSIDRAVLLNDITFNVEASGVDAFVRLTSQRPINEPFLSLVLDTRWPSGRVLSEYTMLLDPPTFATNQSAPVVAQPVASAASSVAAPQAPANNSPQRLAAQAPSAPVAEAANADVFAQEPQTSAADEPSQVAAPEPASNEPTQASNEIVPLAANDNDGTVTVGTDDTLWDIAMEVRPDNSVTVQQTMLALQRLNTEAFIGDNINMVRRGQVLRVPDLAQISALSARDAVSEVSRQNQLFDNRRNVPLTSQPLAAQPNAMPDASANQGELSLVTDDSADQSGAQSANGARSAELDSRISGLEDALAVQQEETDRVNLRADELSDRLRLLEEQIESAREIIRLRDLELAQLQQSLAEAAQAEDVAAEGSEEPVVEEPVITMAPEKSFVQSLLDTLIANTFALIGAVVLIVVALVFVLLRRNRHKDEDILDDLDAMAESVDEPASEEAISASSDETEPSDEALDEIFNLAEELDEDMIDESFAAPQEAAEGSDAVSELLEEADVMISQERYEEAISLLQDGIVAEPNSSDLRLKLLEVCVAKQDAVGFKLQETELRESASAGVLARIEELKDQLRAVVDDEILDDGDEEFFAELESDEEVDDLELALDMEASAEVDDDKVVSGADEPEEERHYGDQSRESGGAETDEQDPSEEDVTDDVFDLSTDADDEAIEFAIEESAASEEVLADEEAVEDENLVDFDFTADEAAEPASSEESGEQDDINDIEFDISDLEPESPVEAEQEDDSDSDNDIEFDFDIDDEAEVDDAEADDATPEDYSASLEIDESVEVEEVEAELDENEFTVEFEEASGDEKDSSDEAVDEPDNGATSAEDEDDIVFDFEDDEADKPEEDAAWELSDAETDEPVIEFALDEDDAATPATIQSAKEDLDIEFDELETDATDDSVALEAPVEVADDSEPEVPNADDADDADDEFGDLQFLSGAGKKSDSEDEDDDLSFLSDADEAATKLDLARAYFEMGDLDGAKEILDEVVKEGTEEQIKDAKVLLEKL